MKFVSCTTWIGRGVCKQTPDKIALTEDEVANVLWETKANKNRNDEDDDDDIDDDIENREDDVDEFDMDNYDNSEEEEEAETTAGLSSIACFASNKDDPYMTLNDEEEDSEAEDFLIQTDDDIIVVADVHDDCNSLKFYVYNEAEGDCFVHHDITLSLVPLCVEWMGYDDAESSDTGNFVAVGGMSTAIEVWDVDIVDCIEPAFTLGSAKKKKKQSKKKTKISHTSDILDLAWNSAVKNILASGSADSTVVLWDVCLEKAVTQISQFKDKVQSLHWHPFEANVLLTGSCDRSVRLFDCRTPDTVVKEWTLDGEVEKVIWNHFDPFYCFACSDNGSVYCYDARLDSNVWTLNAHPSSAVTGLSLSSSCPGLMVSASVDGTIKIWDIQDNKPSFVSEKKADVGKIYTTSSCVDSPFLICCGGDDKNNRFKVLDLTEWSAVRRKFGSRQLMTRNNSTDSNPCSSKETESKKISKTEEETETEDLTIKKVKLSGKKSIKSEENKKMKKKKTRK